MQLSIRPVREDEVETFQQTMGVPFGFDPTAEMFDQFRNVFEVDRLRAAYDGDQMVATFGARSLQLTVPGGVLPTAGTTVVTVLPTHRRRGILRSLMTEHLAEVHERGEPLAALWASESSIYGRFGYGMASERAEITIKKPYAQLQKPVDIRGAMRLIDFDEAMKEFPTIYQAAANECPGMFQRDEKWWRYRVLRDPEYARRGKTAHRRVLHLREGRPVGYVLFRTQTNWDEETEDIYIVELIGVDDQARKALWQFIFGIDLAGKITSWNQPIDEPLRWWVENPRQIERSTEDSLWIRLVDAATALTRRHYSQPGTLVFRLRDEYCPGNDGVYRLEVDGDGAGHCQLAANAEPEIDVTPDALGSVYLGGHRFSDLARAGIIRGSESALRRGDAMFAWHRQPWCQEVF